MERYGSLYEEFRYKHKGALFYHFLFLVRRLLIAGAVSIQEDLSYIQILIVQLSNIAMIIYLILARPFTTKKQNNLEIFNDLCVLAIGYHFLIFTDYVTDTTIKLKAEYSVLIFTLLLIAVNTLSLFFDSWKDIKETVPKMHSKYCTRKIKKNISQKRYLYRNRNDTINIK